MIVCILDGVHKFSNLLIFHVVCVIVYRHNFTMSQLIRESCCAINVADVDLQILL